MTAELEELIANIESLKRILKIGEKQKYCPHEPFQAQKKFLDLDCFEALYGGSAGSGKSDCLLMAALQYVDRPGYNALIIRKTYRDLALPGAIMSRAHEWLSGTDAHWNGIDKVWTFPSGAKLQFGYLDTEIDKYRYQGSELSYIGTDELTQLHESQYVYLLSRLRRVRGVDIPLRARAATNPGGTGHEWVKRRFVDEETRGDRVFVPAKLADNPFLDQEEYRKALENLDAVTKAQLLEGIWIASNEGLVYRFDPLKNLTRTIPPGKWTYMLGIDFGINDKTAFTVIGWRDYDQTIYVLESFGDSNIIPSEAARIVQDLMRKYPLEKIVGDTGGMGKAYAEEFRRRYHIPIQPAEKQNKLGYISLINGMLEEGKIKIHAELAQPLIKEMMSLPWHPSRLKELDSFDNHHVDSLLYSCRAAYAYIEGQEPAPAPKAGTPEFYDKMAEDMEQRAVSAFECQQRMEEW